MSSSRRVQEVCHWNKHVRSKHSTKLLKTPYAIYIYTIYIIYQTSSEKGGSSAHSSRFLRVSHSEPVNRSGQPVPRHSGAHLEGRTGGKVPSKLKPIYVVAPWLYDAVWPWHEGIAHQSSYWKTKTTITRLTQVHSAVVQWWVFLAQARPGRARPERPECQAEKEAACKRQSAWWSMWLGEARLHDCICMIIPVHYICTVYMSYICTINIYIQYKYIHMFI